MDVRILTLAYNVHGQGGGGAAGPADLLRRGLVPALRAQGHLVTGISEVRLDQDEERAYGGWVRVGSANRHLARLAAQARSAGEFALGLLADCNGSLGVLGGLAQGDLAGRPRRVGLVWVDAHGDYNTPETSPSGMLGGMPVAVAAGRCLAWLRERSGLRTPLQPPDIIMVGLRDLDPAEREAIESDGLAQLELADLAGPTVKAREALGYLAGRQNVIYVHVDLDILDPRLAPAAGLAAPGGVDGQWLGRALAYLASCPKVGALGFASYDPARDHDGGTAAEVMAGILGATSGLATADRKPAGPA